MKNPKTSIAKVTPPAPGRAVPRPRLFRLLDRCGHAPLTWIAGPAGSGKTTLVRSWLDSRRLPFLWYQLDEGDSDPSTFFYYLGLAAKRGAPRNKQPLPLFTPEYLPAAQIFSRRYFESLCSRLRTPFLLVFDNYHYIDAGSAFHDIFREGLSSLPPGVRALVVSRSTPPPSFAPLHAANRIEVVGWEALRLTAAESRSIVVREAGNRLPRDVRETICERAQGWAAGLLLMAKDAAAGEQAPRDPGRRTSRKVFDYIAGELFDKADRPTQEFLLKTSFFRHMTPRMAEGLTGVRHAGRILEELHRGSYFTERSSRPESAYQYHGLFRYFLQSRAAEEWPPRVLSGLRRRAGVLSEEAGLIEEAAELFVAAAEWTELFRIIVNHGPSLSAQGRTGLLERWLGAFPERLAGRKPWLLFWRGMCRLSFDPADSRKDFEKAHAFFSDREDPAGIFLSWSCIVESYIYEWNDLSPLHHWISALQKHLKRHPSFPSQEIEERVLLNLFIALALMQPWHPELPLREKRLESLLERSVNTGVRLLGSHYQMLYSVLVGNIARADRIFTTLRRAQEPAGPAERVLAKTLEAYYFWAKGYREESLHAVKAGLETAHETGVYIWSYTIASIGAYSSLASGDRTAALNYFESMERYADKRRGLDTSHSHYLRGWQALMNGEAGQALEHAKIFLELNGPGGPVFFAGFNHLAASMILFALDRVPEAHAELKRAREIARRGKSALLEYHALLVEAEHELAAGRMPEGLRLLTNAFALGRKRGIFNFDWWIPRGMRRLCVLALERNIETSYVHELIRRHDLLPDPEEPAPASWPWPVRVFALGPFRIELNERPVSFGAKAPRKPLELLKALVSRGAGGASEARLADALWPDAAGDAGHSAFTTNLQRLRQLLGGDEFVVVRDGRVGLDPRRVWVDAWAFDNAVSAPESAGQQRPPSVSKEGSRERLELAVGLYQGAFLADDEDKHWATAYRERLRVGYLDAVAALGALHERFGRYHEAMRVYRKGLDVDELAEDLYQRLMFCFLELGKRADAVRTYNRCRAVLAASLGVEPSGETERIYTIAVAGNKKRLPRPRKAQRTWKKS